MFLSKLLLLASFVLAQEQCRPPVDIVVVQDNTGAMTKTQKAFKKHYKTIPDLINKFAYRYRLALVNFRDKYYSGGVHLFETLWCNTLVVPFTTDIQTFGKGINAYDTRDTEGTPKDAYTAIISALRGKLEWRPLSDNVTEWGNGSVAALRVILLNTNANPHTAKDGTTKKQLADFPAFPEKLDEESVCKDYDYPTEERLLEELGDHQAHLGIVTNSDRTSIVDFWKEFVVHHQGPTVSIATEYAFDADNFVASLMQALEKIVSDYCNSTVNTTTTTPTTTTTTTTATVTPDTDTDTTAITFDSTTIPTIPATTPDTTTTTTSTTPPGTAPTSTIMISTRRIRPSTTGMLTAQTEASSEGTNSSTDACSCSTTGTSDPCCETTCGNPCCDPKCPRVRVNIDVAA